MRRICRDCLRDVVRAKSDIMPSAEWECQYCGIAYTEIYFVAANRQGYFINAKNEKITIAEKEENH